MKQKHTGVKKVIDLYDSNKIEENISNIRSYHEKTFLKYFNLESIAQAPIKITNQTHPQGKIIENSLVQEQIKIYKPNYEKVFSKKNISKNEKEAISLLEEMSVSTLTIKLFQAYDPEEKFFPRTPLFSQYRKNTEEFIQSFDFFCNCTYLTWFYQENQHLPQAEFMLGTQNKESAGQIAKKLLTYIGTNKQRNHLLSQFTQVIRTKGNKGIRYLFENAGGLHMKLYSESN